MTYTTKDKVKDFSHIPYKDLGYGSDSEFDAFVNDLITHAESVIDNFCDVPSGFFNDGGVTVTDEYQDLRESDGTLKLNQKPILSISSCYVNTGAYGDAPDWFNVPTDGMILYPKDGMLHLHNLSFYVTEQNVKVTYRAGYASTPKDVAFVCEQLCSNVLHDSLQRKVSPVVRVDDWAVRIIHSAVFTDELKQMLRRYRQRTVSVG